MYKLSAVILCLCSFTVLFGQDKGKSNPFVFKGLITECAQKHFLLFYKSDLGISTIDIIPINSNGDFFFETFKIQSPVQARFSFHDVFLFVASGYALTLTGNGKGKITFYKSKKISGAGSESNQYFFLLDSIAAANTETAGWFDLDEINLVKYVND